MKWIDQEEEIEIYGDGTQVRDFTFVDDIARRTIAAPKLLGYEVVSLGEWQNPTFIMKGP